MTGVQLLDKRSVMSCWYFGLVLGVFLYPMSMGMTSFDPYVFGMKFSWLFLLFFILTILFFLKKNSFGIVLMICIFAYDLKLLESPNFWDYLIDPFFFIASVFMFVWQVIALIFRSIRSALSPEC